jgi:hypothetical protein
LTGASSRPVEQHVEPAADEGAVEGEPLRVDEGVELGEPLRLDRLVDLDRRGRRPACRAAANI